MYSVTSIVVHTELESCMKDFDLWAGKEGRGVSAMAFACQRTSLQCNLVSTVLVHVALSTRLAHALVGT